MYRHAQVLLQDIPNLAYIRRSATNWGGFGLVQATLDGLRMICQKNDFDYVILLSGQDFPIKPKETLKDFLLENFGISYLEYYRFPHPYWRDNGGYDRIRKWHFMLPMKKTWVTTKFRNGVNKILNAAAPDRQIPNGLSPYGGAQWWCLYQDCVHYIVDFLRKNRAFLQFFKTVRIPDEIIFHTILLNSHLSKNIENRKLTYVDWNGPPFPRILKNTDLAMLQKAPQFFARKFDILDTPDIFERISDTVIKYRD